MTFDRLVNWLMGIPQETSMHDKVKKARDAAERRRPDAGDDWNSSLVNPANPLSPYYNSGSPSYDPAPDCGSSGFDSGGCDGGDGGGGD